MSSVIWHSPGDAQRLYVFMSGCNSMQISNVTRAAGSNTATATLNGIPAGFSSSSAATLWVYNTGDTTLNADALTSFTVTSGVPPTISYTTQSTTASSHAQGMVLACSGVAGGAASGRDGVFVTDITTPLAPSTKQDWTNATLANANTDAGAGWNTCAEMVSGGHYVSASPYVGPLHGGIDANGMFTDNHAGVSPGITFYNGPQVTNADGTSQTIDSNTIFVWPNEGQYIYVANVDVAGKRLSCQRFKFSGTVAGTDTPANTNNNGTGTNNLSTNTTWGTWHRFAYFPGPDVFFLVNAPDQPARILRVH
jgi:hypothetical protein